MIGYGLGLTTAADLDGAGITHYILSGYCGSAENESGTGDGAQLTDVYADQAFLGGLFGTGSTADAAAASLKARVEKVESAGPAGDRKTAAAVYFLGDAIYTYGKKGMVSDEMRALGLTNVSPRSPRASSTGRSS